PDSPTSATTSRAATSRLIPSTAGRGWAKSISSLSIASSVAVAACSVVGFGAEVACASVTTSTRQGLCDEQESERQHADDDQRADRQERFDVHVLHTVLDQRTQRRRRWRHADPEEA